MWRYSIIGERFPCRKEEGRDLFFLMKEKKVFEKGFSLLKSRDDDQKGPLIFSRHKAKT
jgi:hypothetical protein